MEEMVAKSKGSKKEQLSGKIDQEVMTSAFVGGAKIECCHSENLIGCCRLGVDEVCCLFLQV